MTTVSLNVYLFFTGTCREAMEFYQSVFGGELSIQTTGEMMGPDTPNPDSIMHAELVSEHLRLMASDGTRAGGYGVGPVSLSINGNDMETISAYFKKLSEGGTVTSDLKTEVWGDTFGELTDKYGIDWMVNITK